MNGQQPYVAWDGATSPFGTSLLTQLGRLVEQHIAGERLAWYFFLAALVALALETLLLRDGTACSLEIRQGA